MSKNLESLGRVLSKTEQKKIKGGYDPVIGDLNPGCSETYTGCGYKDGQKKCDYHIVCDNGYDDYLCDLECHPGDGADC